MLLLRYLVPLCVLVGAAVGGCSTAPAPSKVSDAAPMSAPLSPTFQSNCARCHGPQGKGVVGPDLTGLDFAIIENAARHGFPPEMPAFSETQYPTDVLRADAAILQSGTASADVPMISALGALTVGTDEAQFADAEHFMGAGDGSHAVLGIFGIEPFVQPYIKCMDLPDKDNPTGPKKNVCVNALISGSTEEGYHFADFGVCKDVRTQRPFNPLHTVKTVVTDPNDPRLADKAFMNELAWVNSQIRSSGCVCCHDSSVDKKTAFWDIAVPNNPIWTDQLDKYATEVFTGRVDSTAFGAYPNELNHGFDRHHTGLPSTDPMRMRTFFLNLANKLGTTPEEIAAMPPLADVLAGQLRDKPKACPSGVGVYADQTIHWTYLDLGNLGSLFSGDLNNILALVPVARYIYILAPDSVTPLVPPNLDRPAGMIWRLDRNREAAPFFTGLPKYPTAADHLLPPLAKQAFPEDGSLPEPLVPGQTYYLDAQIDTAFPAARCLFTYPAG